MKISSYLKHVVTECFFFFCAVISSLILFVSTGHHRPGALFLIITGGFLIVSVLRNVVWRYALRLQNMQRVMHVVFEYLFFSVVAQIFLVLVVPLSSVVPEHILSRTGIIESADELCSTAEYRTAAQLFWGNAIDFTHVHVYRGGGVENLRRLEEMGILKEGNNFVRSAMTFGNTIYVTKDSQCLSKQTFFHEMTHVWQFQTQRSELFGIRTIPGWLRYEFLQMKSPDILYEYNGYYGLKAAYEHGKGFFDFNLEQQAMFVEHLMWFRDGFMLPEGRDLSQKYIDLLQIYTNEMLEHVSKPSELQRSSKFEAKN